MHAINIRAAWEAFDADAPGPALRLGLPLDWSAVAWPEGRPPARVRLVRRFGRAPGVDPDASPRIRLRGFAGVVAIELNDAPVSFRDEDGWLVVDAVDLQPRNALTVLVDLARAADAPGLWGNRAFLEYD